MRALLTRAVAIDEKAYGAEHPKLAQRLSAVANILMLFNLPLAARPLLLRAVAIDEKAYGLEHPSVAQRLSELAHVLSNLKYEGEARASGARAFDR
jgi:hypothetical protein